ncbi:MAG: prohibitin family protein [Truepera sp.]|jgi:regulator of protease activity HflC (stomatin/prohibitin superfamily)|nr:prohibitin family protein [Truepera sp.]
MALLILIGLVLVVGGIALIVQGTQSKQGGLRNLGSLAVVVGIVLALISNAFVVVPAGNAGVVFNVFGGVQDNELGEGFHVVLPFLQQVTLYDVRQQELTLSQLTGDQITSRSSEGLEINADATILYQISPTEVAKLHQDIGPSYVDVRIRPEIRSQVRDAIAEFNAAELISTRRQEVSALIETSLQDVLAADNIRVLAVLLRDVRIPASITQAIEEKQAAEQQIQVEENRRQQAEIAAQRLIIEAEGQRDAQIARAEGEAQALELRGNAIRTNPEIIQLEVAERLAPGIQTIMLPSESNFLLDFRGITSP